MSDDEFYRSRMGRKFYEHDVPRIADSLERLVESMAKLPRAILDAPLSPERPFVEQVWVVVDVEWRNGARGAGTAVYASERRCREAIRDHYLGSDAVGIASHWLKKLEEWDGQSDATIAQFAIRVRTVEI